MMGPHPGRLAAALRDEDGYTLVETSVALALLVAVLVPTALAVVALTRTPVVRHRSEALAIARSHVEAALAADPDTLRTAEIEEGPWRIARLVEPVEGALGLQVEVYRLNRGPLVTLEAARLVPVDAEPLPAEVP
ncbi:MAG: hypothetical protein AAF594_16615 [Bacteroidota bacterium]